MCRLTHICILTHTHTLITHMHAYTRTHTHTYTRTHTHTHTHTTHRVSRHMTQLNQRHLRVTIHYTTPISHTRTLHPVKRALNPIKRALYPIKKNRIFYPCSSLRVMSVSTNTAWGHSLIIEPSCAHTHKHTHTPMKKAQYSIKEHRSK